MEKILKRSDRGYLLFEVMIAVAIFAIVAMSLARSMQSTVEATNYLDRQLVVRYGLESILNEAQQRQKRDEMRLNYEDSVLGVKYTTELQETRFVNSDGQRVDNLFTLLAKAVFIEDGEEREVTAEVYVYRPS